MIRRFSSPFSFPLRTASLALALCGAARLHADDAPVAAAEKATPAEKVAPVEAAETPKPSAATPPASRAPAKPRAKNDIEGRINLGAALSERGDYASAEIAYRQVLNEPNASEHDIKSALLGLAHMHRRQGAFTKATAIYERFLKDYPGDERTPDALLNLGRTLRSLGVYKLALARFYSVINSTLKLPGEGFDRYQVLAKTAQFEIAETHFQAGEFEKANKYYTRLRLLDLAPADRARAHFKAGYSLRLQGDLEGATTTLRSYIEQWPDDENVPEARYLLATTFRELKRPQEAFAATLELLRTEKSRVSVDPKRWAYWQRKTGNQIANEFFETGDTLNARAIYAGLLELSPESAWRLPITYQLGLCYERLGVAESARAAYKAIVEGAGPEPSADILELVTMAKWRIEHLEWRDRVSQQISTFFNSTAGKSAASSAPSSVPSKTAATP